MIPNRRGSKSLQQQQQPQPQFPMPSHVEYTPPTRGRLVEDNIRRGHNAKSNGKGPFLAVNVDSDDGESGSSSCNDFHLHDDSDHECNDGHVDHHGYHHARICIDRAALDQRALNERFQFESPQKRRRGSCLRPNNSRNNKSFSSSDPGDSKNCKGRDGHRTGGMVAGTPHREL